MQPAHSSTLLSLGLAQWTLCRIGEGNAMWQAAFEQASAVEHDGLRSRAAICLGAGSFHSPRPLRQRAHPRWWAVCLTIATLVQPREFEVSLMYDRPETKYADTAELAALLFEEGARSGLRDLSRVARR